MSDLMRLLDPLFAEILVGVRPPDPIGRFPALTAEEQQLPTAAVPAPYGAAEENKP